VVRARAAITSSAAALVVVALLAGRASTEPDAQTEAATLYAEGRRYEDTLADPVRALAIYERVLREHPDASVAMAAEQHAAHLRAELAGGHAQEARAFARLVAEADQLSPDDVMKRGDALAGSAWTGAREVELWLAEWLRRAGRFSAADARYAKLLATWPGSPEARRAASGRAGAAIDARAWDRARELVDALPAATPEDGVVRGDLRAALARGQSRARCSIAAWLAALLAFGLLLASLGEAALRGGARKPALAPPVEIWFLGPIAIVLAGVAFTAHQAIAPAVLQIALAGLALAWLSGATLDLLRSRGRAWKARAIAHVLICALGVLAVGYLAVTSGGLLDLL
jgi:tetratricopeptide (TPR) repeat protein